MNKSDFINFIINNKPVCTSCDPFAIIERQCFYCKRTMKGKHYTFIYYDVSDTDKKKPHIFYTGLTCGKSIFEVTGQNPPKETNIFKLKEIIKQENSRNTESKNKSNVMYSDNINRLPENKEGLLITQLLLMAGVKKGLDFTCSLNMQFMQYPNKKLTFNIAQTFNNNTEAFCLFNNCKSIRDYLYNLFPDDYEQIELPIFESFIANKDKIYI